jgi:multidrug efflux pump subunit AcrB
MFFMGATNAIFVGLSVPLSMFLAFLVMPTLGFSLNMIVLFSFLLALGIVVDDAIVVIENTHRIFSQGKGKMPIVIAAKKAAGEVFLPVLSGTLTTLAPFVPLAFWQGIVGKFMFFLPVTLIITLLASLLVAYIINPVFAVDFMTHSEDDHSRKRGITKAFKKTGLVFLVLSILGYIIGGIGLGNFVAVLFLLYTLHYFWLERIIYRFQHKTWPRVQDYYKRIITWALVGKRPVLLLAGTLLLMIFSFIITGLRRPGVVFFPQAEPNFTYIYIATPVGTSAQFTDSIVKKIEKDVFSII